MADITCMHENNFAWLYGEHHPWLHGARVVVQAVVHLRLPVVEVAFQHKHKC